LSAAAPTERRLAPAFFERDAAAVARDLIGCSLLADGVGGRIVETEAYAEWEPACHAHVGVTERTRILFGPAGRAYVYLSYGVHQLFNVVTGVEGAGAAVLIRALEPTRGVELMRRRRPERRDRELCAGPGRLTAALAIGAESNGADLEEGGIGLLGRDGLSAELVAGPRIGISKAVELPWRYCERDSPWLSATAG
jgi:DNA-3-methyladenine glycosylase